MLYSERKARIQFGAIIPAIIVTSASLIIFFFVILVIIVRYFWRFSVRHFFIRRSDVCFNTNRIMAFFHAFIVNTPNTVRRRFIHSNQFRLSTTFSIDSDFFHFGGFVAIYSNSGQPIVSSSGMSTRKSETPRIVPSLSIYSVCSPSS